MGSHRLQRRPSWTLFTFFILSGLWLLFATPSSAGWKPAHNPLRITEVFVTFNDPAHGGIDTITIRGRRFGRRPQVTLGSFPPLVILSASDTEIVAECPMTVGGAVCAPGDYRLRVTSGRGKDRRTGKLSLTVGMPSDTPGLQGQIDALRAQVESMQAYIDLLQTYIAINTNATPVQLRFTGVNVYVDNGEGATDTINGAGNLIVGYHEPLPSGGARSGSHNLVVGPRHNYTNYGGVVFGDTNTIAGPSVSVTGGMNNTATGAMASVSGGTVNEARGTLASVSGGRDNEATGSFASVSGGRNNRATTSFASVSGGASNSAIGLSSSVSGGTLNTTSGSFASISGGRENVVSGNSGSISGGGENQVTNNRASVSGGDNNIASGIAASVSGGLAGTAPDQFDWRAGNLFEDD